jgi:nonsense-mediated mRNA decay protein 3
MQKNIYALVGFISLNKFSKLAMPTNLSSSQVGTSVTSAALKAKAAVNKDEAVEIPVLQTSIAYGIYMSISSNLR